MIAMQYGFVLPGDYDMAIIRRRIAENGHRLDDFPGLLFKAYLHAARGDARRPSRENLYAPLYLWHDSEGMNEFLGGAGFAALTRAFGWPAVRSWSVWRAVLAADLAAASCATRECLPLAPYSALDELRRREGELAQQAVADDGALAAISAYEPTGWNLLRFRLWREPPAACMDIADTRRQLYEVGHVSLSEAAHRRALTIA